MMTETFAEYLARGFAQFCEFEPRFTAALARDGGWKAIAGKRYIMITPNIGAPGWRLTWADEHGPAGHTEYRDSESGELARDAMSHEARGYIHAPRRARPNLEVTA